MFVACDHLPCCLWILRILLVSTQKDSLFLKLLEKKYLCNIIVKFLTHVRYVIGNIMISLWSMVFLCKKKKKTLCLILFFGWCFWFGIYQVNVVSYKTRPAAKDFIQVSIGGGGFGCVVALLGPFKCHCCLHQTTFLLVWQIFFSKLHFQFQVLINLMLTVQFLIRARLKWGKKTLIGVSVYDTKMMASAFP